jgi:LuxR family transcriptional regulator, maltose regulon positive regulatory protein
MDEIPVVRTKLHVPPGRRELVPRPRLFQRLDEGLGSRLILLSGPAGFGKTTLLAEWLRERDHPAGWLSLDEADNDLNRFLSYFLHALQAFAPDRLAALIEYNRTAQSRSYQPILSTLINTLDEELSSSQGREFLLVLDDYHLIEAQAIHDVIAYLLERLPSNLHLVISSRSDPPLPLPRLRARAQLTELRAADLRFSTQEAADFLQRVIKFDLSSQAVQALVERTEGWIAGLQMAALALQGLALQGPSMQGRCDPLDFIDNLSGSQRFILDYLVEEVLQRQAEHIQRFLIQTSILTRFCGPLCDHVLGIAGAGDQPESTAILEYLHRANLFIIPLDDERLWYRYHRLFSDLLRKRFWQLSPDLAPTLHSRASHWYEQQGFINEAIQHALAANSYERAATLIENNVEATLMRSEVKTFLNWMEKLPDEYVRTRSRLTFFHAWALLISGQSLEVVERRLQSMASIQGVGESTDIMAGRISALRAYLMLFQADFQLAAKLCRQALENLPESDLFLRSIVTWILSMIRLSDGEVGDGRQSLDKVIRMGQEIGNPLIAVAALSHKARLQMRQGRLRLAHETLLQALQLATDPQGRWLPIASEALIVLGELEREWNNLEKADEYLTGSIQLARQWNELASFDAYYPLMRLRLAQGNVAAAREAIETAWQMANRSEISQIDDILADLQRAYFFVMQGDSAEIMRWAEQRGLAPGVAPEHRPALDERQEYINAHLRKYEQLVLARAFVIQGRTTGALELLDSLLDQARQLDRTDLAIEIQILRARAFQQAGENDLSGEAFAEALSLAEPGGYIRTFLDEGEPMIRLLHQAASRGLAPAYVARLLAACGEPATLEREGGYSQALSLVEPLSQRELEVLRLLAGGLSNPEIASQLYIAVSTVRTHCKNIYGKLGVRRRWDAVQRAQELGLI